MTEEVKPPAPETPPDEEEETKQADETAEADGTETTLLTEKEPEGEKTDGETRNAPEEYEPFTTPNESPMDQEVLGEFQALAKGLDLSQEQAQSLVDLQARYAVKVQESATKEHKQTIDQWRKDTERDPEFGGGKLKETLASAQRVLTRFADKDFSELLNASGLGNHPALVRLLAKVDAVTKDDTLIEGTPAGKLKPKSLHEALYKK